MDSCSGIICRTTIKYNTTSKMRETPHNYECLPLDYKEQWCWPVARPSGCSEPVTLAEFYAYRLASVLLICVFMSQATQIGGSAFEIRALTSSDTSVRANTTTEGCSEAALSEAGICTLKVHVESLYDGGQFIQQDLCVAFFRYEDDVACQFEHRGFEDLTVFASFHRQQSRTRTERMNILVGHCLLEGSFCGADHTPSISPKRSSGFVGNGPAILRREMFFRERIPLPAIDELSTLHS
ncbi:hypothetical protein CSKR_103990 [Clonorchis sinensis]|uniref:Uncharacterized protein n=1 Tax=Clonorchis sinensis TaxID=79923 RepID=A0A3R7JXM7_CLOSI|nr:hypothetical protein CSKR_103990 [Clonorchis sinensis]